MSNIIPNEYPRRRPSAAGNNANVEYPRRGRAAEQVQADDEMPQPGKPVTGPTAPGRPARVPDKDDPPPRRGQPVQRHREVTGTEHPRRGGPSPVSAATPQRSERAVKVDDPPFRRTRASASAPRSGPLQATSPVAAAKEVETAKGGSAEVTFTTGRDAAELEIILKMVEQKITDLDISARDLHTLASLFAMAGSHVSSLAKQKEEAGKGTSLRPHADDPPEPED